MTRRRGSPNAFEGGPGVSASETAQGGRQSAANGLSNGRIELNLPLPETLRIILRRRGSCAELTLGLNEHKPAFHLFGRAPERATNVSEASQSS